MPRLSKAESARIRAEYEAKRAAAVAIVVAGVCPQCGAKLCRNLSITVMGRKDMASEFETAKQWAGESYCITEWARTPFGSWMDAAFVAYRLAELKAQIKEKTQ